MKTQINFRSIVTLHRFIFVQSRLVNNINRNKIFSLSRIKMISQQFVPIKFLHNAGGKFSFHLIFFFKFLPNLVSKLVPPLVKSQEIAVLAENVIDQLSLVKKTKNRII